MTGQEANGTVTQPLTDDELREIEKTARASMPSGEFPTLADRRRALYEAGMRAVIEADLCGVVNGTDDPTRLSYMKCWPPAGHDGWHKDLGGSFSG